MLPLAPETVKDAGVASEAGAFGGVTVPDPQTSVTVTEAGLSSEKSLLTVKTALAVLMIVQVAGTPSFTGTLLQALCRPT